MNIMISINMDIEVIKGIRHLTAHFARITFGGTSFIHETSGNMASNRKYGVSE